MPSPSVSNALFKGISFPFRRGATSFPETAVDDQLIRESLIQLVLTGSGERIMRPTLGSNAYKYIFESNDDLLQERIEHDLTTTVGQFEPRVALLGVQVVRGEDNGNEPGPAVVTITLSYIVVATRETGTVDISISNPGGV